MSRGKVRRELGDVLCDASFCGHALSEEPENIGPCRPSCGVVVHRNNSAQLACRLILVVLLQLARGNRGMAAKLDGTTVDAKTVQDRPLFSQTNPRLQELVVCLLYVVA